MLPFTYKQLKQIMILRACRIQNGKKLKKATKKLQTMKNMAN